LSVVFLASSRTTIVKFRETRAADAPTHVRNEMACLPAALTWAVDTGRLNSNPARATRFMEWQKVTVMPCCRACRVLLHQEQFYVTVIVATYWYSKQLLSWSAFCLQLLPPMTPRYGGCTIASSGGYQVRFGIC